MNQANSHDTITIQGKPFKVPLRYSAGHVLKDNEASALNQTLHENLRNNFAAKVRDGVEAGLGDDVLQQQLDDYANEYEFGVRGGGGGYRGDPARVLAMNIARELIRQTIKDKKLDPEQWPASKVSQVAQQLLETQGENGAIITRAKAQVETEKQAAEAAMAEASELVAAANAQPAGTPA